MLKLASFFPYLRSRFEFAEGDRSGSFAAHQDLLVHSLRNGVVDEALTSTRLFHSASALAACSVAPFTESWLARRTILDTDQLHSSLRELLESPELRRSFAEAGRERVARKFSWPVVIGQFQRCWEQQVLEAEAMECGGPFLRLDEVFGSYPTTHLEEVGPILAYCRHDIDDAIRRFGVSPHHVPLLQACRKTPQPLAAVLHHASDAECSAVLELIKSGALSILRSGGTAL